MATLNESIEFIEQFKITNPAATKHGVQQAWVDWASPQKKRNVFVGNGFALRFSEAKTGVFSNTVLSLSTLSNHDMHPFVIAVVRPASVNFLLANATFLKKVSHSSHDLRTDKIRGSFNGTDIMTTFEGTPNTPEHFEDLFAIHSAFTWEENLERLVEATNKIVARNIRFQPTDEEKRYILDAPERFTQAVSSAEFAKAERDLIARMDAARPDILAAAQSDNVNIRGNTIEQLITRGGNAHKLGDVVLPILGGNLVVDIKTKLLDRTSAPKAYNVDKMLSLLSMSSDVLAFFIIGVDVAQGKISGRLLTALDDELRSSTRIQRHWAGRGTRGVTQFSGGFHAILSTSYSPKIDSDNARDFLKRLIDL